LVVIGEKRYLYIATAFKANRRIQEVKLS